MKLSPRLFRILQSVEETEHEYDGTRCWRCTAHGRFNRNGYWRVYDPAAKKEVVFHRWLYELIKGITAGEYASWRRCAVQTLEGGSSKW